MKHWLQLYKTKKVSKYDFGTSAKNWEHYGTFEPPEYNLKKMKNFKIKSIMTTSDADPFCNPQDTLEFVKNIQDESVVEIMSLKDYDHIDYLWADSAYEDLYPKFLNFLGEDV